MKSVIAESLSSTSKSSASALVKLIISGSGTVSKKALHILLEEGINAPDIQYALIQCRNITLKNMLHTQQLPNAEREDQIAKTCRYFDLFQAQLLNAVEQRWCSRLNHMKGVLQSESLASLLAQAGKSWLQAGQVEICNQFKDMTFSAIVPIENVRDQGITVHLTTDLALVVAACEQQSAYIPLQDEKQRLKIRISGVRGKSVHWSFAGIQDLADNRAGVRIRCVPPLPITLIDENKQSRSGYLLDFSMQGLTIMISKSESLHQGMYIGFDTTIRSGSFQGVGTICWMQEKDGYLHFAIKIETNAALKKQMRIELSLRRKEAIIDVKRRGMPAVFQSDWNESDKP